MKSKLQKHFTSSRNLMICLGLPVVLSMTACDQVFQRRADRQEGAADAAYAGGDLKEAVFLYEAALDGTPKSAEIHYKLGVIYDTKLDQPLSAVHHFQRYLELAPDGPRVSDVGNFIKEDHLKLITRYGNGATLPQREAVRLKNENLDLRNQVSELRKELQAAHKQRIATLKALGGGKAGRAGEQVQKPLIEGVRTYTVQPGDTLASISRQFYKTTERWKDIQETNFNYMEGTARLRIGMVLMIP